MTKRTQEAPRRGRPKIYTPETVLSVDTANARTRLQSGSERRAIVNALIDAGGQMTLGELNEKFGFDTQQHVVKLVSFGWIRLGATVEGSEA